MFSQSCGRHQVVLLETSSFVQEVKWTRELDFTDRQDILTGPGQEKINGPGSGACWAESVGSTSRRVIQCEKSEKNTTDLFLDFWLEKSKVLVILGTK